MLVAQSPVQIFPCAFRARHVHLEVYVVRTSPVHVRTSTIASALALASAGPCPGAHWWFRVISNELPSE